MRGLGGAAHPGFPPVGGTFPSCKWGTPRDHSNQVTKIKNDKQKIHLSRGWLYQWDGLLVRDD